jgi:hypothetical protein
VARKKITVIAIPPKPPDERFEALDRLAHQLILSMRRNKPARDVVELDKRAIQRMIDQVPGLVDKT